MRRSLALLVLAAACAEPELAVPAPQAPAPTVEALEPAPPPYPEPEMACLAKAAYFEARSEGRLAMEAVVHVVLNRTRHLTYPDTPCGVVEQKRGTRCQFSWFCDGKPDDPTNLTAYEEAIAAVETALSGADDPTLGATMFHADWAEPYWAAEADLTATIGSHLFYTLD